MCFRLSLEVMTLNPICENVETAQGVPLTVTGVAQVKIMKNPELLHTASEQFLGKKEHEIKSTVLQVTSSWSRFKLYDIVCRLWRVIFVPFSELWLWRRCTRTGISSPRWWGRWQLLMWAGWALRSSPSPSRMPMTMSPTFSHLARLRQLLSREMQRLVWHRSVDINSLQLLKTLWDDGENQSNSPWSPIVYSLCKSASQL